MSQKTEYRVLRCFCGCSQLDIQQIENIAGMSVPGLVKNLQAKNLFRNFLKIGHRSDKSNALIALECFELCDDLLEDVEQRTERLDELIDMCPSYLWEERLSESVSDEKKFPEVLDELKKECLDTIQCHNDYDRFRRELLRKIR